jgi:hypothetical protein
MTAHDHEGDPSDDSSPTPEQTAAVVDRLADHPWEVFSLFTIHQAVTDVHGDSPDATHEEFIEAVTAHDRVTQVLPGQYQADPGDRDATPGVDPAETGSEGSP